MLDQRGRTITTAQFYGPNNVIGEIDRTTNNTNSYGGSLQATSKDKLFDHGNIFIAGGSVDHGDVKTTSSAELGTINSRISTSPEMASSSPRPSISRLSI